MDRIENHPILGETPKRKKVTFSYDGKKYKGRTQCVGSAYKHGKKWKNTYSTSNEDNYMGMIGE